MITVGYGDFKPVTANEKVFQLFLMLISQGILAYIIGCLEKILSLNSIIEQQLGDKIVAINKFLVNKGIDENVRVKVKKYLDHKLELRLDQKIEEEEVLNLINIKLKEEILLELNGEMIKNFWYFDGYKGCEKICIIISRLLKEEIFSINQTVFEVKFYSKQYLFNQ